MMELVQITAQYSNAVLVAVLPYVSDFAHKLNLPTVVPVPLAQVVSFQCDQRKGQVGGVLTLTNGLTFAFLDGRVCSYRSPKSYFSLQDPDRIPEFFGPIKIKETQALKTARHTIDALGYAPDVFHAESPPKITPPERIGSNYVARYRFQWLDPAWKKSTPVAGIVPALLDVEVDATSGQIQMVSIAGLASRRPAPVVSVVPPVISKPQPEQNSLTGGSATLAVNDLDSTAFLNAILPQLSDFAAKTQLALKQPITTNDVDLSHYYCRILDGQPIAQVLLKNGDRFNYEHGHVVAFYAHDAYRKFPVNGHLEDFTGQVKMTTNQAVAVCEHMIRNLGYKGKLPKGVLGSPTRIAGKDTTRNVFYWWKKGEDAEFASFEVDMASKTIKSVYLDDPSLWRNPPKISVPSPSETNAPSATPTK